MLVGMRRTASIIAVMASALLAQPPSASPGTSAPQRGRRPGGFVPGQERPTGEPEQIARGKQIYGVSCRGCHGADLRGGDMGGPNLLRSQTALSDREGEKIVPVIQGSLQAGGMPAIPMGPADAMAVASYVRSVLATIGSQGKPPSATEPPTILVGNAAEGQAFFAAKCSSCHSPSGDLTGIASRMSDPKILQNTWVVGSMRAGRGSPPATSDERRTVTADVTLPGGEKLTGKLVRIDDFLITLEFADGSTRSVRREGDSPKVEVHDPLAGHRELMTVLSDKDMHDVTAYLVTLK